MARAPLDSPRSHVTDLLIDATSLSDDSAYRGIGTYVRQLLSGLALDERLAVTALVRSGTSLPDGIARAGVTRIAPGRLRRAEQELLLPLDLRRRRADVFHSPALDPPRHVAGPWIQTLLDVIPLIFDDPGLADERRRWRRVASRYRKAHAVVAISRHTADSGISELGLDARRVEVIPLGVGAEFMPAAASRDAGPDRPYVLMVGEYSRRKGYPEAFAVVAELAEHGHPHVLHVGGRIAPWLTDTVTGVVAAAPRPDRIKLLDYVDDLVAQYQRASLLLVTSRYEGFGLPILEAMACGTPVVAFDNSSLPEVVGDAGLVVPDGDASAMAAAAHRVLDDCGLWRELSERGLERARSFTWERCVAAHAEVYLALAA